MNKQELIEKFEQFSGHGSRCYIERNEILNLVKQLDEPEKVKVPQFVADWITHSKNIGRSLFGAMSIFEENFEIKKWMQWAENQETFTRAWLDGYEVEKEKRYLVKMKDIEINFNFLNRHRNENYWIFSSKDKNTLYQTHHTRKELEEAGFGWVFDCPGIEIEEVE